jgi:predicted Zn-dependent peptidase
MSYNEQENDGIYFVLTQMRTKEMYSTLLAFENTVSDFFNKGITEKELKQNITKLKNEYLSVSQPASIIDFYNPLIYPDIKKRMTYISDLEALTTDAVNKVIKKYYNPDSYKLVIAGNEIKLADQLSKLKGLQKFNNNAIEVDQ